MLKSHGHGERPTKGIGGKRKGVDEYAAEHENDLTIGTLQKDGHLVRLLMCRFCNQPIGARSDRIKEHFMSKRHHKNKNTHPEGKLRMEMNGGGGGGSGSSSTSDSSQDSFGGGEGSLGSDGRIPKIRSKKPPTVKLLDINTASKSLLKALAKSEAQATESTRIPVVRLVDISKKMQECNFCGRRDLNYNIRKHEKMFHNKYKCRRCNYEGESGVEYRVHLSLHDFLDPCSCVYEGCGKSFLNKTTLRYHVWRNHRDHDQENDHQNHNGSEESEEIHEEEMTNGDEDEEPMTNGDEEDELVNGDEDDDVEMKIETEEYEDEEPE